MRLLELFFSFLQVGMFSIGGGYAAMPLIQSQVVELHAWLTMPEFTDLVTIAEMTPGPIAINAATFVGTRVAGPAGAIIATFGSILPACIIVSLLAYVYRRYQKLPALQSVLGCLRPAVVSLIAAAGLSILQTVLFASNAVALSSVDWIGAILFLGAFLLLRLKKWNPILVMSLCGAARLALGLVMKQPVG